MFLLGHWSNYEELEANLTIDELNATLDAMRRREFERMKFEAAIHKGIDISDPNQESAEDRFNRVKLRAEARRLAGGDESNIEHVEDALVLSEIGIGIIEE